MEVYLGQVLLLGFDYVPPGFAFCEGQVMDIAGHPALFGLIGDRFGGDGVDTFALPDLRGKEPADGLRYAIALDGMIVRTSASLA